MKIKEIIYEIEDFVFSKYERWVDALTKTRVDALELLVDLSEDYIVELIHKVSALETRLSSLEATVRKKKKKAPAQKKGTPK